LIVGIVFVVLDLEAKRRARHHERGASRRTHQELAASSVQLCLVHLHTPARHMAQQTGYSMRS
jgi:hypothetical protein